MLSAAVLRFDRRMAEQELEDGEFRPDQEMDPYFLSSIDERVDKLMGEFAKKIEKMNHHTVFNQYDSFMCDPLLPPKPPNLIVSSVLDNMIAAVQYEPQSRDHQVLLRDYVSRSPKLAEVPLDSEGPQGTGTLSAGFSKASSHQCSRFTLPWTILSPKFVSRITSRAPADKIPKVAPSSEETQVKDRRSVGFSKLNPSAHNCSCFAMAGTMHPLKPVISHNLSRAKICEVADDSNCINGNGVPSAGSLKENVPLTVRPLTMAKVADILEGSQARARESGSSKDNPSVCSPKTRYRQKPITHSFYRDADNNNNKAKVACNSEVIQNRDRPSVGFSKENLIENENPKTKLSGVTEAAASNAVAKEESTDEWVGCDICNKWRLLPYGTSTAGLPDKWNCKMQTWLPGLNKCSISEDESGKAFRHLYPIPVFKSGSNLNGHHDSVASHSGRSEKADCATKKQKLRCSGESQAGQLGKKKFKFIDEIYNCHDVIAASDTGKSQKDDCASKKQKVRSCEESQAGQHAGNKKIRFTDESRGSYMRKQKKVAYSSLLKILETEKLAGRKRRINEATVSQEIAGDDIDCGSGLCGIKKKKVSFLENIYLDSHSAVEQKKLGNISSFSGQEGHLSSRNGSTHGQEVGHKESDNNQNTAHLCGMGHLTADVGDVRCTIRKCNNSATIHVLKAATDLKDTAQRLEDEGLRIESTRLYFESALKYLHAASLLEPLGHDDIKSEDAIESIKYYAETSRICESCALEFERCEKLAMAALAYKCTEVAHFKVAFIQHSSTSKDQKELQATFKMVNPGDFSSYFDPGGDCIKTPVWLDPSTMAKDASSPQTVDNPVITAVTRPTYTRWLENMSKESTMLDAIDYIKQLQYEVYHLQTELSKVAEEVTDKQGSTSSKEDTAPQ